MNHQFKRLAAGLLLATGVGAVPASATELYSTTFAGNSGGFVVSGGVLRNDNGVQYIGLTQGESISQTFNFAGYTNLRLSFDLYAVLSLDGNGPAGGGADPFNIIDNSGTIFDYTFANYTGGGNTQSYGGASPVGPGPYAPKTGATGTNLLGYGAGDFGDTEYSFANILLTPGSGGLLTLSFIGNSNQSADDEFYGVDNIRITGDAITAPRGVPEPATWAMMIGGMGMVAGAMRRRRVAFKFA